MNKHTLLIIILFSITNLRAYNFSINVNRYGTDFSLSVVPDITIVYQKPIYQHRNPVVYFHPVYVVPFPNHVPNHVIFSNKRKNKNNNFKKRYNRYNRANKRYIKRRNSNR